MTEKVSLEVAEREFERFVDEMDLDVDTEVMDAEDRAAFEKQKRRIIKATMSGALVFNENAEPIYTPQKSGSRHKDPITFHERSGASLMAMDGKKKNQDVSKTFAVMGAMCGVHPSVFAGLVGIDAKVCEALFALLMD